MNIIVSSSFPPTQTAIEPNDDISLHFRNEKPITCKSFLISHNHNTDVIISARVTRSLFLFTDYQSLSVDPVTYRFFPTHKPCEYGPPIRLSNNISYESIRPINLNNTNNIINQTRTNSTGKLPAHSPTNASPPTSTSPIQYMMPNVNGSLSLYEYVTAKSLRDSLVYHLLHLHKLRRRVNLLVVTDQLQMDPEDDSDHDPDDDMEQYQATGLYHYMMRGLLRSDLISEKCMLDDRDSLFDWFKQCVNLIVNPPLSEIERYVFKSNDTNADRSLQLFRYNKSGFMGASTDSLAQLVMGMDNDEAPHFSPDRFQEHLISDSVDEDNDSWCRVESDIDGIVILSTEDVALPDELKQRLRSLEGFPVLFAFYGLEKCTDVYDAIRKKESTNQDVFNVYTNSHKPFIIHDYKPTLDTITPQHHQHHHNTGNVQDEITLCKFFCECLDVSLERNICSHDLKEVEIVSSLQNVTNLFLSTKRDANKKIEIKDLQELDQQRKSVWFFGLDNEKDSVSSAVNSVHYCCHDQEEEDLSCAASASTTTTASNASSPPPNILICVRSREQFVNGRQAMPKRHAIYASNQKSIKKQHKSDDDFYDQLNVKNGMVEHSVGSTESNGGLYIRRNLSELWGTESSSHSKKSKRRRRKSSSNKPIAINNNGNQQHPNIPVDDLVMIDHQSTNHQLFNLAPDSLPEYEKYTFYASNYGRFDDFTLLTTSDDHHHHRDVISSGLVSLNHDEAHGIVGSVKNVAHSSNSNNSGSDNERHSIIVMDPTPIQNTLNQDQSTSFGQEGSFGSNTKHAKQTTADKNSKKNNHKRYKREYVMMTLWCCVLSCLEER
ncbi:hypothetical protein AKO1_002156 [Acrasis kona]|uniref:Uncharacterized protein n=1 Tax=Acrasis kona TaxID=1008807 RepID=A0AAW2Z7U2_9EUKA